MPSYLITLKALNDIDELAYFIAKDNLDIAIKLYDKANETFKIIADNPSIGVRYNSKNKNLQQIRYFPINSYSKYLAFYNLSNGNITIIRVLHQARDIDEQLEINLAYQVQS